MTVPLVNRVREHFASLGYLAGAGLAVLVFQTYQAAVDQRSSDLSLASYRWLGPLMAGAIIFLLTALCVSIASAHLRPDTAKADFANAIIQYARRLSSEGRHRALLRLRRDESLTLHILGRHEERTELGELALRSAAILSKELDRAAILVDDLGWANYLLGKEQMALENISRGVEAADTFRASLGPDATNSYRDASVFQARGMRHAVVINAAHPSMPINEWLSKLDDAAKILASPAVGGDEIVRRERAQLDHSRSLGIALYLKVNLSGQLRDTDAVGRTLATRALDSLTSAEKVFAELDDDARLAKSLLLRVRLLEAIGDRLGATEARARAEVAIADSAWMELGGIQNILGPRVP